MVDIESGIMTSYLGSVILLKSVYSNEHINVFSFCFSNPPPPKKKREREKKRGPLQMII